MGTIQHHAILVTGERSGYGNLEEAHEVAKMIAGDLVSEVVDSHVNGYSHFFVAPDGSKEGWTTSNEGDERRARFTDWLMAKGAALRWLEVTYGEGQYAVLSSDQGEPPEREAGPWGT